MSIMRYPPTPRHPVVETFFGTPVTDHYRWLEGDAHHDPAVARWIAEQNAATQAYLASIPGVDIFKERMTALLDYRRVTPPAKRANRYFYTLNEGTASQPALYVQDGPGGQSRLLIDPNTWSDDQADALGVWGASDNGRYLAYSVQVGGTDWRTIHVLDVDHGVRLDDTVRWARYTSIAWAPDHAGFFYSRMPEPASDGAMHGGIANHAVYFHRIGTAQSADRLIYATPATPNLMHLSYRAGLGRYLAISSTPGSSESALTVVDLYSTDWAPRPVIAGFEAEWGVIGNVGTRLIVITTDNAARRRVVSLDLDQPTPVPLTILPEDPDGGVLNDAACAGGKLLVSYLTDARTELRRFGLDGTPEGTIMLPGIGTAGALTGAANDNDAFFVYTSYATPTTVYRYNIAEAHAQPWLEPEAPIDCGQFVVEQRFYASKDGTQIPLFLVKRHDVDRAAPTLLYGYGGFRISQLPYYNPFQLAWVEQGGVLAIANIRGGGEYGQAWHQAGQLEHRQNVFDDFIAAAEYLKSADITSPRGLVIQGESGGGLLVGAVTNQRPDLIDVALPGVGVMDMLRYHLFTGGKLWMGEFGDPSEERQFRNLLSYSPYQNIRQGGPYPAILATTADADDRVVPAHTFKYVAALQAAELGDKPRLVRIDTRAGHGEGMSLAKLIALHADMWAFAAHWAGLSVQPIGRGPAAAMTKRRG